MPPSAPNRSNCIWCAAASRSSTAPNSNLRASGDFRVEYNIDLERKGVANARNGKLTSINVDDKEISFGAATDFNPEAREPAGPRTNGPGASATGVVINRSNGRYFSIATRKQFSTEPPPEGSTEPVVITNVRTRQGVCTDGTPSPSF